MQTTIPSYVGRFAFAAIAGSDPLVGQFIDPSGGLIQDPPFASKGEALAVLEELEARGMIGAGVKALVAADIEASGLKAKQDHIGRFSFVVRTVFGVMDCAFIVKEGGEEIRLGASKRAVRRAIDLGVLAGALNDSDRDLIFEELEESSLPEVEPTRTLKERVDLLRRGLENAAADDAKKAPPAIFKACDGCIVPYAHGYFYAHENEEPISATIASVETAERALDTFVKREAITTKRKTELLAQVRAAGLPEWEGEVKRERSLGELLEDIFGGRAVEIRL